jgi:hypothetical protein
MRIYVPAIEVQALTRHLLEMGGYEWLPVTVDTAWGYSDYLQARWDERRDFINLEQDIVFWDGALETLWECPLEWCVYQYRRNELIHEHSTPFLGCAKITARLIEKLPDVWKRQRAEMNGWKEVGMPPWSYCDSWLWTCAQDRDIRPHQHFPSVVNANPSYWAMRRDMVHNSCSRWVERIVKAHGLRYRPTLEVGSCNVNGAVRQFFDGEYLGIDLRAGEGVDRVMDGEHLDLPDAAYQVVVCTEVLEHVVRPWKVIEEMVRVLVPNGYLILTARGFDERGCWEVHDHPADHWRYGQGILGILLVDNGLSPIEQVRDPEGPGWFILATKGCATKESVARRP